MVDLIGPSGRKLIQERRRADDMTRWQLLADILEGQVTVFGERVELTFPDGEPASRQWLIEALRSCARGAPAPAEPPDLSWGEFEEYPKGKWWQKL